MMCKGHLHLKLLSYVPINIVLIVLGSARLALLGSARLASDGLGWPLMTSDCLFQKLLEQLR